jgi:DNA processing protein
VNAEISGADTPRALDGSTAMTDERHARAALTYFAKPPDECLGTLVRAHGAVEILHAIRDTSSTLRLPREFGCWHSRLEGLPNERDLEEFSHRDIRLICPGDAEWPAGLDDLGISAPFALCARGRADVRRWTQRDVVVVGPWRPHPAGPTWPGR